MARSLFPTGHITHFNTHALVHHSSCVMASSYRVATHVPPPCRITYTYMKYMMLLECFMPLRKIGVKNYSAFRTEIGLLCSLYGQTMISDQKLFGVQTLS